MIYLTLPELLHVAERALGAEPLVRDSAPLLESALARPQATAFGEDAYADLDERPLPCSTPWPGTMPWWTATSAWAWLQSLPSTVSTADGLRSPTTPRTTS